MASKLWGELAKRTKARYAKQGVTAAKYNRVRKLGLRGDARAQALGIDRSKISGSATDYKRTASNKIIKAIREHTGGVQLTGWTVGKPINTEKIRARIEGKQPASVLRAVAKAEPRSLFEWTDFADDLEDYDPNESLVWYND